MLDQTFDAAQAGRANKNFRARCHFHCRVPSAFRFEREHSAEHRHLRFRDRVNRMQAKAGIMNTLNVWMSREKFRDSRCVLRMRSHPPWECAHPAQNQPAIKRRGNSAPFILNVADALEKFAILFCHQYAAENVAVTAEVLRRGMKNEVRAKIERPLENRRPSVVANANSIGLAHDFTNGGKIDNLEQGI